MFLDHLRIFDLGHGHNKTLGEPLGGEHPTFIVFVGEFNPGDFNGIFVGAVSPLIAQVN